MEFNKAADLLWSMGSDPNIYYPHPRAIRWMKNARHRHRFRRFGI